MLFLSSMCTCIRFSFLSCISFFLFLSLSHMAERDPRNELSREIRMRLSFECKRGADTVNLATNDCSIVRCFTSSQEPKKNALKLNEDLCSNFP